VDKTTGTIRLKATFPNTALALWPGQFVRASLRLSERENALVIPAQAVQTGINGQYVFVVKDDLSVEMRTVQISPGVDQTLVADTGLKPGEKVVINGQVMLVPGSLVEIRPQSSEASVQQSVTAPAARAPGGLPDTANGTTQEPVLPAQTPHPAESRGTPK